jgi:transcriptional regulator of arginine metabolism
MEVIKQLRHRQIRDLVERQPIRTQHELAAALRERGFRVTQATVSRDISEIGLVKATRDGGTVYELPPTGTFDVEATPEQKLRDLLAGLPIDLREAGQLLVIRAVPGSAHAIAAALDRCHWPEVIGSLAGDDTLFIAFADTASLRRVQARVQSLAEM